MTTAVLVGATGLIGDHCLDLLLARPEYDRVTALVRRPIERRHDRLEAHVVDFEALDASGAVFAARDVYCCLGTTMKIAGSQDRFRRVDHDYPVEIARRARAAGAERLGLVSAVGADVAARSFYLRVKGETERDVAALGYATLVVARPSFLLGERRERRPAEAVGIAASRALSFLFVGGLRPYRPIHARQVATALIAAVLEGSRGTVVLDHAGLIERT